MKTTLAFTLAALALLPAAAHAAPTKKKSASPTLYVCSTCHMQFSAADAKKDHFKDPMDGGALAAVKPTAAKPKSSQMSGMNM